MSTETTMALAAGDPAFGFGSWLYKQALYQYFTSSCECISPTETIPPRAPVPPPTDTAPYPTDHDSQQQRDRIERNTTNTASGQTLLYQGLQVVATHVSDMWSWVTPNVTVPNYVHPPFTMQGEGYHAFGPVSDSDNYYYDVAGIATTITQLPTKFKARGTLNPRYYGIGSIYWDGRYQSTDPMLNSQRESIHYTHQVIAAPRTWIPVGVGWYLQPGAIVQAQQILRNPQAPSEPWYQPNADAFQNLGGLAIPDHINDPPLWPPTSSSSRIYALGSPP